MAKDAVATMGTILTDDVGGRDAVHVAVISVRAKRSLQPGAHASVTFKDGEYQTFGSQGEPVGIVDPFLEEAVAVGERFWLYLYPRTITGLNHNWSHPAFGDVKDEVYAAPATRLESERWVRDFAARGEGPSYDEWIRLANGEDVTTDDDDYGRYGWIMESEYLHGSGRDAHGTIDSKIWDHLEIITGKKQKHKPAYFSCSC